MKSIYLISQISILFILFGCNSNQESELESKVSYVDNLITSQNTLPLNFHDIAFTKNHDKYLVQVAHDNVSLIEQWESYNLVGDIPQVDMTENNVFFLGVTENSSCPAILEDILVNTNILEMEIVIKSTPDNCTSDEVPRNIVFFLDKELSDGIKKIIYREGEYKVELPVTKK